MQAANALVYVCVIKKKKNKVIFKELVSVSFSLSA